MPKEKNIYSVPLLYRGQQTFKQTWATSYAEASRKLDVPAHTLKKYGYVYRRDYDVEFEGCQGYIDSGQIIFGEYGDPSLKRKQPWEELEKAIQDYNDRKYQNSK